MLAGGEAVPPEFSRPEVLEILTEYYRTIETRVEVTLHRYATGDR